MTLPRLHLVHDSFPGLPARALDFFDPQNAHKEGGSMRARTVYEFAQHIAIPGEEPSVTLFPPLHRINLILQRMVDLNLLTTVHRGGIDGHETSYFCPLESEQKTRLLSTLDYVVYGFPVIYKELSPSVIPIVHVDTSGKQQIGTAFLRTNHTILTAAHCVLGAKALSIRGISSEQFARSAVVVHRNEALDLAAIHFSEPVLPGVKAIELGTGTVLDEILVLGYPNVPGFTEVLAAEKAAISSRVTVIRGSIASKTTEIFAKTPLFLITARVRGGFSGSPAINSSGLAVGLVSRQPISGEGDAREFYTQYDNLGYGVAIPTEEIVTFLTACRNGDTATVSVLDVKAIEYRSFGEC